MDDIEVMADTRHGVLLKVPGDSLPEAEGLANTWAIENDYPLVEVELHLRTPAGVARTGTGGSPTECERLYYYLQLVPNWAAQAADIIRLDQVSKL